MSTTAYTPGPWDFYAGVVMPDGECYTAADGTTVFRGPREPIAQLVKNPADGRLIEAAPDLAEAAAGFLKWFQGFLGPDYAEVNCRELDALKAALAKAGV
jgi:hypothetical protein